MAADLGLRRVVTGLDDDGESCVVIDGAIPQISPINAAFVWRTEGYPADNSSNADTAVPHDLELLHTDGSNFAGEGLVFLTKLVKQDEIASHLPADSAKVSAGERAAQLQARFYSILRRYVL